MPPAIGQRVFGTLPDGRVVHEFTLEHGGLRLSAITLGGIVTALWVPDAAGRLANVVLGFDNLDDYVQRNPHFGAIIGRYGNRIAGARFTLDGQVHQLTANDGANCLHGGARGFGARLWQAEPVAPADQGGLTLALHYTSEHGEEGFPGRLEARVRYTLGADASWRIDYEARCDRATVVNLTHHDYFNLAGGGSALGHALTIAASRFAAVDAGLIPRALVDVAGTPFDFRRPTVIAQRIREGHEQLRLAQGYDHGWRLDHPADGTLQPAAQLHHPGSGRTMELLTTEPALQFYSGNFLDGRLRGSSGALMRQGDGLCLETQHLPDSPNHPPDADWPDVVLRPGAVYRSSTLHRFSAVPVPPM